MPRTPSPSPPDSGHRARLVAGLAAALRERGSVHALTVADVVRHARTSRRTFYEHFAGREACFLALAEELSERQLAALAAAAAADVPWVERLDRALAAWLEVLAADPAVARSCILELPSLGPDGVRAAQRLNERWARQIVALVEQARASDPALRPMSLEVATVITGGFRDLVLGALERGADVRAVRAVGADLIGRLAAR